MNRFCWEIFKFSQNEQLILNHDKVLVCISGGLDSTSLFHILTAFKARLNITLEAIHFHHGLREKSNEEQAFVENLCKQKDVPLTIYKTLGLKGKTGVQSLARQWRNHKINQLVEKKKFTKVATGHHLDDLVETQIWKIIRGCSLFSLKGMSPKQGLRIHPLLYSKKLELKRFLISLQQNWVEDPTNFTSEYTRNKIRNQIVPLLEECSGKKLGEKLKQLSEDSIELNFIFKDSNLEEISRKVSIPYSIFKGVSNLFASELIHRYLLYHGAVDVNRSQITDILHLIRANKGGWKICLKNHKVITGMKSEIKIDFGL